MECRWATLIVINVPKLHTRSEPRFRALLTEDGAQRLVLSRSYSKAKKIRTAY
jgi:hypothetical protein